MVKRMVMGYSATVKEEIGLEPNAPELVPEVRTQHLFTLSPVRLRDFLDDYLEDPPSCRSDPAGDSSER